MKWPLLHFRIVQSSVVEPYLCSAIQHFGETRIVSATDISTLIHAWLKRPRGTLLVFSPLTLVLFPSY